MYKICKYVVRHPTENLQYFVFDSLDKFTEDYKQFLNEANRDYKIEKHFGIINIEDVHVN